MAHAKTSLIVLVAFSLPSAVKALGLGEIHLDSALNEPLAAEVDIVGATAEDLAGITASVAKGETFLRFGIDRPAFLSSATFRLAMDVRGQPVLAIRSTEAFTDPLINMLIDVRWRSGELIRQYTLLLDPPRFSPDIAVAQILPTGRADGGHPAEPPAPVGEVSRPPALATASQDRSPVIGRPVSPEIVTVAAGATLRGIASRISARGDVGLERLMIAIFHANPNAFAGNINRLRRGVQLSVPSIPEVAKISEAEANQEFRLQMDTWHATAKVGGTANAVDRPVAAPAPMPYEAAIRSEPAAARTAPAGAPTEPAAAHQESISKAPDGALDASGTTVLASGDAELDRRVQVLESGLNELQGALHREQATLAGIQAKVALADRAPAATVPPAATAAPAAKSGRAISIAAVLVIASVALGVLFAWRRRRMIDLTVLPADAKAQQPKVPRTTAPAAPSYAPTLAAPARSELPRIVPVNARAPDPVEVRSTAPVEARSAAKAELRKTVADAFDPERTILAPTSLRGGDSGMFEHAVTLNSAGTIDLASTTIKTRILDVNAQTTPLEAVRTWEMPELSIPAAAAAAADTMISANKSEVDTARLQYKLLDLDGTVHYVPMPSILSDKGGLKERRTSLVDVLKVAVKREPNRRDLRMKLLETYHAAAATSRQGFLEVAQSLAGERDSMSDSEWSKIVGMGRQIAADDDLFAADTARTDKLATYA